MTDVWAYITHKDGRIGGVVTPAVGKRELRRFLGDFAIDGYEIKTAQNREEYLAFIKGKPFGPDKKEG
ncbi:MAG: hypothetical protein AABZ67_00495 [Pseudomonadota bacterium]